MHAPMVPVDVVVDVLGYVSGIDALVPLPPTRLYDSREVSIRHVASRCSSW